jgi:hypothetical protein
MYCEPTPGTHGHRGRNAGDAVKEIRPRVQGAVAGGREGLGAFGRNFRDRRLELIAGDEQIILPRRTGVVVPVRLARIHKQAARGGVGDRERFGENLFHPCIRRKGLAFDDADGG